MRRASQAEVDTLAESVRFTRTLLRFYGSQVVLHESWRRSNAGRARVDAAARRVGRQIREGKKRAKRNRSETAKRLRVLEERLVQAKHSRR
jgi:hypothetical protein